MNGLQVGTRMSQARPRTGREPPGHDRVSAALRKSSRLCFAAAVLAVAAGVLLVAAALLARPAGGLATPVFLGLGVFLAALAFVPFTLGWRRRRRLTLLAALRDRWVQLARAGDPGDQVEALARSYAGIVGNDLRARLRGTP